MPVYSVGHNCRECGEPCDCLQTTAEECEGCTFCQATDDEDESLEELEF